MDVSVRKLRYFVAVADELHFTKAALRLVIAQQSLSRGVRELEEQIGAQLFHRTHRSVELTSAGRVLYERVRPALEALDDAVASARLEGHHAGSRLRLGFGMFAALELTSHILAEFQAAHPAVEVEMREYALPDQTAGLADGWADVAFIRPPLETSDLRTSVMFVEPRILSVSKAHPFARLDELDVEDVLPLTLSVGMSDDNAYRRFWSLDDFRGSIPAPTLRRTSTNTEELELVAAGLVCTVNPAAVQRYLPQDAVSCIPIRGIPGSAVALAWRRDSENAMVAPFVQAAHRVLARETELLAKIESPFGDSRRPLG